jgi:RND family efflux transporter MFP subunit
MKLLLPFIKRWWKPLAGLLGFAVMIVYSGGFLHEKVKPESIQRSAGESLPAGYSVIEIKTVSYSPRLELTGTTASDRQIQISSRISAYVQEVLVNSGDKVTNGQVLARLDDREMREQAAAAQAQFDQASAELKRARQLHERQATTEQALTAAESTFNAAKAGRERAQVMLSYATVVSPINGIVSERQIEAGDLASPGLSLFSLFDPANMRLEVPVPVRLISKLEIGQFFIVQLDYPARSFTGHVTEIVGMIDPLTRTQRVKLHMVDTHNLVLPGTFGRIWVEDDARPAIQIPAAAVQRVGQLEWVTVAKNDRGFRRLIRSGTEANGMIEVISGLNAGDRIVWSAHPEE